MYFLLPDRNVAGEQTQQCLRWMTLLMNITRTISITFINHGCLDVLLKRTNVILFVSVRGSCENQECEHALGLLTADIKWKVIRCLKVSKLRQFLKLLLMIKWLSVCYCREQRHVHKSCWKNIFRCHHDNVWHCWHSAAWLHPTSRIQLSLWCRQHVCCYMRLRPPPNVVWAITFQRVLTCNWNSAKLQVFRLRASPPKFICCRICKHKWM